MALLELKQVTRHFELRPALLDRLMRGRKTRVIKAVESMNLTLGNEEILGIAGESGCGKSTTCMMVAGLLAPSSGQLLYRDRDVNQLDSGELNEHRRRVQMIFQDPYESLNPRFRVSDIVAEGPRALRLWPEREISERAASMLDSVGLPYSKYWSRYPHELSGGERQRVGIASALVMEPELVVADEPLSMLDVSIRAGILDLLRNLARQRNFACIYVSHDLSILGNIADRLLVMYLGQAMEVGAVKDVIMQPRHPYTRALISAVPVPDPRAKRAAPQISGDISRPVDPPPGCRFAARCPYSDESCRETFMKLEGSSSTGHQAACHRLEAIPLEAS
ncbi:MAG: ATP-binding cassette domain-containing protein [Arenicellales bacterium]|jgi:oligopeptide/dipeptide ABC transporter ATP-binding protein|nr:ATP-binding cassette domain-containing protein [Arenicellales bacterium]MDP7119998.1 ATP-binding cassette domain-containing protein [Arenicellales bacterium]MDP7193237.1 ATP-binding cassette domain-containing protein [Arenicellales bacterium]MDP7491215.1 ATP-binding cassette domain-containing protein [Arenicellales bacterium]MDP7563705.1 ATP-binding cassette domain-containing protein [Arenicellales bacterium]|tara:strand:- start:182 stop:1186 length:1005 start_codon:yes stop_codon:yes gene_type:complete